MRFLFILLYLIISTSSFSQPTARVPVFTSGSEGHSAYRIPAIIRLPGGDLLAFCEGRVNDAGDFGDINIVMKRSSDDGNTWSTLQTIVDYESLQAGNPAPIVDMIDPQFPQGRIFLFYNTGNNHENEIRKGNGLREVWYKTSTDNGYTWSAPINITTQTHRPKQPQVNPAYNFNEDWRSYANTPGHALQFSSGKYKGRIFVAANGWDTTYFDENLPDPVCQGSILALGKSTNTIAFCNAADTIHRNNLTLRISFDEGKTWKKNWIIDKSQPGQEMSHAAYSDLIQINKKTIGILYERDNYKEIVFVKYAWR